MGLKWLQEKGLTPVLFLFFICLFARHGGSTVPKNITHAHVTIDLIARNDQYLILKQQFSSIYGFTSREIITSSIAANGLIQEAN